MNAPIDSTGVLPDGTHINDITDFKAWLVDNIDMFSQCLAEKLIIYATGRAIQNEGQVLPSADQAGSGRPLG